MMARARVAVGVLAALVVGGASTAVAVSGLAPVSGTEKLQLKGCGKATGNAFPELRLTDDGAWLLTAADATIGGNYVAGGKGGRTLTLALDAASLGAARTGVLADAAVLCGGSVDTAVVSVKTARVKLNKSSTTAGLLIVLSVAGDGDPLKKGKYQLKGKGTLGPLPTTTTTSTSTSTTSTAPPTTTSTTLPSTSTSIVPTTTSTLATTSTSIAPSTSTTLPSTTTTVVTPTTSTTIVATGYGDCVNGGTGACLPSETCVTIPFEGQTVGLCTRECTEDTDCPLPTSGDPRIGCDPASGICLLLCDAGETCPAGMACVADQVCLFTGPCTPNCEGRVCGDDGCGTFCGECAGGEVCVDGGCLSGDACVGRCGTSDPAASCQCDDFCVGEGDCCPDLCSPGVCDGLPACTCVPDCTERTCGSDGCFGTCGECGPGDVCSPAGQCVAGDSCAGRCGTFDLSAACQCDGACSASGDCCPDRCDAGVCDTDPVCTCVPDCTERACGSDGCFGSCGECVAGDVCSPAAQCVSGSSCLQRCESYDAAAPCQCDSECFTAGDCCPDLCEPGVCDTSGICTCVPDCTGRTCGPDGCFGECGTCDPGDVCNPEGQCLSGDSCVGRCDTYDAAASCQCDLECVMTGDCCLDLCDPGVCDLSPLCVLPPA